MNNVEELERYLDAGPDNDTLFCLAIDMLAMLKETQATLDTQTGNISHYNALWSKESEENTRLRAAIEKGPCQFKTGLECSSITGSPYCLPSQKDVGTPYVYCWKRKALERL